MGNAKVQTFEKVIYSSKMYAKDREMKKIRSIRRIARGRTV